MGSEYQTIDDKNQAIHSPCVVLMLFTIAGQSAKAPVCNNIISPCAYVKCQAGVPTEVLGPDGCPVSCKCGKCTLHCGAEGEHVVNANVNVKRHYRFWMREASSM